MPFTNDKRKTTQYIMLYRYLSYLNTHLKPFVNLCGNAFINYKTITTQFFIFQTHLSYLNTHLKIVINLCGNATNNYKQCGFVQLSRFMASYCSGQNLMACSLLFGNTNALQYRRRYCKEMEAKKTREQCIYSH